MAEGTEQPSPIRRFVSSGLKDLCGDGRLLRLGLQAYALGIAYEFDPRPRPALARLLI